MDDPTDPLPVDHQPAGSWPAASPRPAESSLNASWSVVAGVEAAGARLDRFLTDAIGTLSRSRVKALIEEGHATADGAAGLDPADPVRPGVRYAVAPPQPRAAHPAADADGGPDPAILAGRPRDVRRGVMAAAVVTTDLDNVMRVRMCCHRFMNRGVTMSILRRGLLAFLCIAAIPTAASAQDLLARMRVAGAVRVGFPNQVPYAYADEGGKLTGADADIARLVFERMGIKMMDGVLTEFAALIPGLRANRFDTVLAMFVTPARCAQVAFSEPIYAIGQGMVVRAGNPVGVTGYGDFVQKPLRLAVMAGAAQAGYAKALGIPEDRVVAFPDGPSAMAALSAGRADAFAISDLPARRLLATAGASSGLQLVPDFVDPVIDGRAARGYDAFAFRPADTSLRDAFNAALAELKATPEFLAAMAPFGFTAANLPDRTTEALCK